MAADDSHAAYHAAARAARDAALDAVRDAYDALDDALDAALDDLAAADRRDPEDKNPTRKEPEPI